MTIFSCTVAQDHSQLSPLLFVGISTISGVLPVTTGDTWTMMQAPSAL
jgi:hypothetical protein